MQTNKISHELSIYWRSVLMISLIVVVFSLQGCNINKYGAATPDRVVEQYLQALENKDNQLMLRLAPEKSQANQSINSKILKIGGHRIQGRQITYTKPKPTFWTVKINGNFVDQTGIKRKFDDSIAIEYQSKGQVKLYGGRWYLLLEQR